MRSIKYLLLSIILFLLTSCDPEYCILMVNNSEVPIYFAAPEFYCTSVYPDTVLPIGNNIPLFLFGRLESKDTLAFYWSFNRSDYCGNDTCSIYIFNADTLDYYSYDTVVKYNKILQRYDFSRKDLDDRFVFFIVGGEAFLFFPPTADMNHIHMWPPYGTYDEHGRKKE